jgi:hypothetical protein
MYLIAVSTQRRTRSTYVSKLTLSSRRASRAFKSTHPSRLRWSTAAPIKRAGRRNIQRPIAHGPVLRGHSGCSLAQHCYRNRGNRILKVDQNKDQGSPWYRDPASKWGTINWSREDFGGRERRSCLRRGDDSSRQNKYQGWLTAL